MHHPPRSTLQEIYANWGSYQHKWRDCIASLTNEQFELRPAATTDRWPQPRA